MPEPLAVKQPDIPAHLQPKTMQLLRTDLASKLSPRSQGGLTYVLLADEDRHLHLAVTGNEGGGLWSKEAVRLDTIAALLAPYVGQPFATKVLRDAFHGKSNNNAPFCAAVLKDLGLLAPSPDKPHQHVQAGDWAAFSQTWLAKEGVEVTYPEAATPPPATQSVKASGQDIPVVGQAFALDLVPRKRKTLKASDKPQEVSDAPADPA
ncbi:MAG: hypothetical protein KIG95_13780 [Comamonas sp.]|nr:hypothetical protein [Comamonas sp.]